MRRQFISGSTPSGGSWSHSNRTSQKEASIKHLLRASMVGRIATLVTATSVTSVNVGRTPCSNRLVRDLAQVSCVVRFPEPFDRGRKLAVIYEAHPEGDLFGAGDLGALATFERAHERSSLEQAFGRAGIEPRITPAHDLDMK